MLMINFVPGPYQVRYNMFELLGSASLIYQDIYNNNFLLLFLMKQTLFFFFYSPLWITYVWTELERN
jgi:hypothetical protein